MRIRITFAKTQEMRYTGHLDLHHTWERTFRRANLPLAYTQGFNPHPRINLASALPLGFTGEQEVVDIWLEQDLPLETIHQALAKAAPPGIHIQRIEAVEGPAPSLQTELQASEYELTWLDEFPGSLEDQMAALLVAETLPRERRGKAYDLRPLVLALHSLPDSPEGQKRMFLRLVARESATGRPEEVIEALGGDPTRVRVHRTRLVFQE